MKPIRPPILRPAQRKLEFDGDFHGAVPVMSRQTA
jgi:hypothetical protein